MATCVRASDFLENDSPRVKRSHPARHSSIDTTPSRSSSSTSTKASTVSDGIELASKYLRSSCISTVPERSVSMASNISSPRWRAPTSSDCARSGFSNARVRGRAALAAQPMTDALRVVATRPTHHGNRGPCNTRQCGRTEPEVPLSCVSWVRAPPRARMAAVRCGMVRGGWRRGVGLE